MTFNPGIAFDADGERWVTLSNGKRCKLDGEGTVIAGFEGFVGKNVSDLGQPKTEIKPYSRPVKTFGEYLEEAKQAGDKNAHVKAARQFYKDNLQNTFVATSAGEHGDIDVHFSGKGWNKLSYEMESNPLKAALVEDIPDILKSYSHSGRNTKPRSDYKGFHYFEKTIKKEIKGTSKTVKVKVDVGIRRDSQGGYEVYHLSHDAKNRPDSEAARRDLPTSFEGRQPATAGVSSALAEESDLENSIGQVFEFVNMEILEDIDSAADSMPRDLASLHRRVAAATAADPAVRPEFEGLFRHLGNIKVRP